MPANYDQVLDARQARRMAAENRLLARQEQLEAKAEPMIGELCRNGRTVYYCYPVGGKYYENRSHTAVVDYLVRNRYVTLQ